jgi:maltose alpha-D-glucosyltransferase/alpha-amylase
LLVLIHQLENGAIQVTALNFGSEPVAGGVRSGYLPAGAPVTDLATGEPAGVADAGGVVRAELGPYQGKALLITPDGPQ